MKMIKSTVSADLIATLKDLMLQSGALSVEFATVGTGTCAERFPPRLEMTVYANDSSVGKIIKRSIGCIKANWQSQGDVCIHSITPVVP